MINLVTVVGENTHILPHMLKHYNELVDKIYVVVYRQNSDDKILEEIEELGVTPHLVVTEPKYNWERVTDLYNKVKLEKPNEWWIVSDDDELQVYPNNLEDIIDSCEKNKYDFVTGGFLDRIGIDGSFPIVDSTTNLHMEFPLAGFFRYPMSKACPNKVTLMKGYQRVSPGQHYAVFDDGTNSWGNKHPKRMPVEECFTQVHHFKWDSSCIERLKKVANVNKHYAYSHEYLNMYNAIKKSQGRIDVNKSEFLVEYLTESSYISYNDYSRWEELTSIITKI